MAEVTDEWLSGMENAARKREAMPINERRPIELPASIVLALVAAARREIELRRVALEASAALEDVAEFGGVAADLGSRMVTLAARLREAAGEGGE